MHGNPRAKQASRLSLSSVSGCRREDGVQGGGPLTPAFRRPAHRYPGPSLEETGQGRRVRSGRGNSESGRPFCPVLESRKSPVCPAGVRWQVAGPAFSAWQGHAVESAWWAQLGRSAPASAAHPPRSFAAPPAPHPVLHPAVLAQTAVQAVREAATGPPALPGAGGRHLGHAGRGSRSSLGNLCYLRGLPCHPHAHVLC